MCIYRGSNPAVPKRGETWNTNLSMKGVDWTSHLINEFTQKIDFLFIHDDHLNFSQLLHKVNRIMSYFLTVCPHTRNPAAIQKIDESSSLHGRQRHSAGPIAPQRMHLPHSCSSSSSSLPGVLLVALVLLPRHSLHISGLFPGPYDVPSCPECGQEKRVNWGHPWWGSMGVFFLSPPLWVRLSWSGFGTKILRVGIS